MFFTRSANFSFSFREKTGWIKRRCKTCRRRTKERVAHVARVFNEGGDMWKRNVLSRSTQHHWCHARWCNDLNCIERRLDFGSPETKKITIQLLEEFVRLNDNQYSIYPWDLNTAKELLKKHAPKEAKPKAKTA
ncbi:MAG: hypothetical protein Q8R12_04220 [bacterium]|nr:hypothetical protein [bacterium]